MLNAKAIDEVLGSAKVPVTALAAITLGCPVAIALDANGARTAIPAAIAAGARPGQWGIAPAAIASSATGYVIIQGTVPVIATAGTAGNVVTAIAANGSVTATGVNASATGQVAFATCTASGLIIY